MTSVLLCSKRAATRSGSQPQSLMATAQATNGKSSSPSSQRLTPTRQATLLTRTPPALMPMRKRRKKTTKYKPSDFDITALQKTSFASPNNSIDTHSLYPLFAPLFDCRSAKTDSGKVEFIQ